MLLISPVAIAASGTDNSRDMLRQAIDSGCREPSPGAAKMATLIPGSAAIHDESLTMRGAVVGWERHFELPEGVEIRMRRLAPGGRLRRLEAEYWTIDPEGAIRPRLAVVSGQDCGIQLARRRLSWTTRSP